MQPNPDGGIQPNLTAASSGSAKAASDFLGEWDFCPFPLETVSSPTMGLLKSSSDFASTVIRDSVLGQFGVWWNRAPLVPSTSHPSSFSASPSPHPIDPRLEILPSSESCLADAGLVLVLTPQKVSQTCHMACLWHPVPRLGLVPYSTIQTCCGTCMLAYLHCYPVQALGLLWYNGKGRLVPFPTERLKHPNGSTQANTKSWPSLDK